MGVFNEVCYQKNAAKRYHQARTCFAGSFDISLIFNDVEKRGAIWSFEQALRLAADDAVYIQDDMILCRWFVEKANKYCAKYSNSVIVFSNLCYEKNQQLFREGFYDARIALYLMCTYIPKRIADLFLMESDTGIYKPTKPHLSYQSDDGNFSRWLQKHGEDVFLTVPNLAGHPKNISSIDIKRKPRICHNFDYNDVDEQWRNLND